MQVNGADLDFYGLSTNEWIFTAGRSVTETLGVSDGTGAGNRRKNPAISQGDVVMGKFLDGDRKQNPVIMNVLGRTEGIRYGSGRFQSKTGFVGSTQPRNLMKQQETSEEVGPCSPKAITSSKTNKKSASSSLLETGLSIANKVGQIPKPPININKII